MSLGKLFFVIVFIVFGFAGRRSSVGSDVLEMKVLMRSNLRYLDDKK